MIGSITNQQLVHTGANLNDVDLDKSNQAHYLHQHAYYRYYFYTWQDQPLQIIYQAERLFQQYTYDVYTVVD